MPYGTEESLIQALPTFLALQIIRYNKNGYYLGCYTCYTLTEFWKTGKDYREQHEISKGLLDKFLGASFENANLALPMS